MLHVHIHSCCFLLRLNRLSHFLVYTMASARLDGSKDREGPTKQYTALFVSPSESDSTTMENCFEAFDLNRDNSLNVSEFEILCQALFRNEEDISYPIEPKRLKEMFSTFDINQDGRIDANEFKMCWQWIKKIVRPISALIVVDVQNDFITGSLSISNCPAKQNGAEVVEPINCLLDTVEFDCVYYSLDWHPSDHVSFVDNVSMRKLHETSPITNPEAAQTYDVVVFEGSPPISQKLWPRHCVQNSWGAKLEENLKIVEGSPFIYKGTNPDVDSYSAFFDNCKIQATPLVTELKSRGVTDCYICGIAYDVCVGATAFHAIELGYRTILVDDASRGITHDDIKKTRDKIIGEHGVVVSSDQVKAMVQGRDRRPELGFKLALELRNQKDLAPELD